MLWSRTFDDVDNSARIAREEIFGPVGDVIPFTSKRRHPHRQRHAVWLAAAVWSRDIFKAFRVVKLSAPASLGQSHGAHVRRSALGRLQRSGLAASLAPTASKNISEPSKFTSISMSSRSRGTDMPAIQIRTAIPGPRAQELLKRREAAIPRGVSHATPIFAARAEGANSRRC